MIQKSKSLWLCVCEYCEIKIINAANKLKIYYYSKDISYKLLKF